MKKATIIQLLVGALILLQGSCIKQNQVETSLTAKEVFKLYGPNALAFGGYRHQSRDTVPSVADLKEDMLILNQMGCHLIRTYHTQQFGQVSNLLKAIAELKEEKSDFSMYVMLGAWVQCKEAWTKTPIHQKEDLANNQAEIQAAIKFAQKYPDIIKVIAVGNEAMVHWASGYYVEPEVILSYVEQLQNLKKQGELSANIWITSSDNFASWGGGGKEYHKPALTELIRSVDYVSLHTYPFHDTHYNPSFWKLDSTQTTATASAEILMGKALEYAQRQYYNTVSFVHRIDSSKAVHIGETGWASHDVKLYGKKGSKAADEFKQQLYYQKVRKWCKDSSIACFYFEAFDEPWKDATAAGGSENHFGLITVDGKVKGALWREFDHYKLSQFKRGNYLKKNHNGDTSKLVLTLLTNPQDSSQ